MPKEHKTLAPLRLVDAAIGRHDCAVGFADETPPCGPDTLVLPERLFCVSLAVDVRKAEYWPGEGSGRSFQEFDAVAVPIMAVDANFAEEMALFQFRQKCEKRGVSEARDYKVRDWNAVAVPDAMVREAASALESEASAHG